MSGEIIAKANVAHLEQHFVDLVREAKGDDPLAPVSVIVGSNLQHIYLRRLLARSLGAIANVRFLTLLDLAGEVYLSRRLSQELRPLPEGAQVFLLETVLERISGRDGLARDAAGLPQAVAATLRDLREARMPPDALETMQTSRPWIKELARAYASHQREIAPFLDRTRLFEEAALASDSEAAAVLLAGPVLVYGVYDLNAVQLDLITKLARERSVALLIPWNEGVDSLAYASGTIDRLLAASFTLQQAPDDDPASRGDRAIFSCADRQAEVEEAVRRVLQDIEDGVPLAEIAILHRLDQVFDEMLAGVLERAELPFYLASGRPVRRAAVGRAALSLLQLMYEEPRRGTLLELLSLPCTDLAWVEEDLAPRPARWEALSKEFGLVKGWDEFRNVLTLQLATVEAGDPDERQELFKEQVGGFLNVVEAFAAEAERLPGLATWAEHAAFLIDLLGRLAPREQEGDAFAAISDRLSMLAVLDDAGVPVSAARFRDAADAAIRQAVVSGGYFQRDGIFVGSVMAARLLRFRRTYLLECSERTFPPVIRQDPLLLDDERALINETSSHGFLPIKRDRLEEERLLFELACQAGTERLTFGYSRHAARSHTVRLPSSFVLDEAQALSGVFMSGPALERASPPWFLRMPSRIGFQSQGDDDALRALDGSDLRFHMLEEGGRAALDAVRPLWPGLARLGQLRRERNERRFGPYDGIVPPELLARQPVLDRDLSASALSDYAVCPYRFFLSKVLGLRARNEPEETLEIAPVERGNLVHRILERFVNRYLEGGGSWADFLEADTAQFTEIMEEEFSALPQGIRGLNLTWRLIKDQVAKELQTYLEEERRLAAEGWQPTGTELWFEGVSLDAGSRHLTVRGRIDRLDRSPAGVRVVDYKTGAGGWDKPDGYRRGGSLQFPIYLHAAAQREHVPLEDCRAEFHYVSERAGFDRLALTGAELSTDDRFRAVLGAMAEGIESGAFFYIPDEGRRNCRLCDFKDVCHSKVDDHMKRKRPGSRDLMEPFQRLLADRRAR